jgi:hypothetical protein
LSVDIEKSMSFFCIEIESGKQLLTKESLDRFLLLEAVLD